MKYSRLARLSWCLMVALVPALAGAESYEVTGEIVYTPYPENATAKGTTYAFHVMVDGDKWKIRNTPKEYKGILYQEAAYDGKELRQVTQFDPEKKTKALNRAVGWIEPHSVPPEAPPMQIGSVWLALASSGYLKSCTNDMLHPVWSMSPQLRELDHRLPAKWTLSVAPPFLPSEVRFLSDGNYYSVREEKLKATPVHRPYNHGYLLAHFKADSVTNVNGKTFPLAFTLNRFAPKRDGISKEDLSNNARCVGRISAITEGTKETEFSPRIISSILMEDHRFRDRISADRSVQYLIKDKAWPAPENPVVQKGVAEAY